MSGRKLFLGPFHCITAGDMSGNLTGIPSNIAFYDNVAYQANFTGSPTGTFKVQGSLDWNDNTQTGNWITIGVNPVPAATGSSGNILVNLDSLAFPWIRIIYTFTSGTGTLDAFVTAKML